MGVLTVEQLDTYGPDRCESMTPDAARAWCRDLARGHYENFSVLSALVPADLRDDCAAVYAFCRWADDLGDEIGDPARSRALLAWWREELQRAFDNDPRHPVFVALTPVIQRHDLPMTPFDNLIRAFEQDQDVTRFATWDEVLAYCRLSADPVGRLVLMVCGEPRTDELFQLSDHICTALQLTNHWQDVQRDLVDRDRVYIPAELNPIPEFERRLRESAALHHGVDREFLGETRPVIRECVERTWRLFEKGLPLLDRLSPRSRPLVWLFAAGGQHVLRKIELWNHETVIDRPTLTPFRKLSLVGRARWMAWRGKGGR